ncbi:MAG: hypothetical protein RLZZ584_2346 [Pseudomonadota bacterium]|jgi:hypothetical protein
MSLDERDYMQRRPARRGRGGRTGGGAWMMRNSRWAPIWLWGVAVLAVSWAAEHWLHQAADQAADQAAERPGPAQARRPAAAQAGVASAAVGRNAIAAASAGQPARGEPDTASTSTTSTSTTTVYRCRHGGQVSYSDAPGCPGGAAAKLTIETPPPAVPDTAGMPPPPQQQQRQRQPQPQAGQATQRYRPADSAAAQATEQRAEQRAEQAAAQARSRHLAQLAARDGECGMLNERIQHLDALARLPNPGQTMDDIRRYRQAARDRQFALKC